MVSALHGHEQSLAREYQPIVVNHSQFDRLQKDIQMCMVTSADSGEPQCMALEGRSGVGKSTLVTHFARKHSRIVTRTETIVPVLYVQTPSPATVKDMATMMLEALGDPLPTNGTTASLNLRLEKLIKVCRVELVILDDFHHLIDSETDRVLLKVSDWLKALIKRTCIPYVVVGIEGKVDPILRANPQLSRLFAVREVLRPLKWNPARTDVNQEFDTFYRTLEDQLAFSVSGEISRADLFYRLHYATDGVVSNLVNLLRYALVLAEEGQRRELDLRLLSRAFSKRLAKHLTGKQDPFTPNWGQVQPAALGVNTSSEAKK